MTDEGRKADALGTWCGWLMVAAMALVPLIGWLGPLGFAVFLGLVGLLGAPAFRITDEDRPLAVMLFAGLLWAAVSTVWSPYHPTKPGNSTALKLAFELPLYWSAICAGRRADPRLQRLALRVLAWGAAGFGVVLLAEFATDARLYETLHVAFYQPIRHDLAQSKIGYSTFVLALIFPLAFSAALRSGAPAWLAIPTGAGVLAAAARFGSDAPVLAIPVAAGVFLAAWRWPAVTPRVLGVVAAAFWLCAPVVVWAVRASGYYAELEAAIPLSWSERMSYWSHALDWIGLHPFRGWGLDASRMFSPGINLHPHDDALQVWLELGVGGAILAAAIWWVVTARLARAWSDIAAAGATAAAGVYLLFAAVNFGVWQEWWLAMAALAGMGFALMAPPPASSAST